VSRLVALRARDAFFPPLVFPRLPLRLRDELWLAISGAPSSQRDDVDFRELVLRRV
jgi:hypothetical protein